LDKEGSLTGVAKKSDKLLTGEEKKGTGVNIFNQAKEENRGKTTRRRLGALNKDSRERRDFFQT